MQNVQFRHRWAGGLGHVLIGCFITGAFFVMSIACLYLVKNRHVEFAQRSIKVALPIAVIFSLLALFTGHHQAQTVSVTQPAKLAAMKGHFTSAPADLYLFGWPDAESGEVKGGAGGDGELQENSPALDHGHFSKLRRLNGRSGLFREHLQRPVQRENPSES